MVEKPTTAGSLRGRSQYIRQTRHFLELVDSLKPAGAAYPAHIHASGEEDEAGIFPDPSPDGGLFGRDWAEVCQRICKHQPG